MRSAVVSVVKARLNCDKRVPAVVLVSVTDRRTERRGNGHCGHNTSRRAVAISRFGHTRRSILCTRYKLSVNDLSGMLASNGFSRVRTAATTVPGWPWIRSLTPVFGYTE